MFRAIILRLGPKKGDQRRGMAKSFLFDESEARGSRTSNYWDKGCIITPPKAISQGMGFFNEQNNALTENKNEARVSDSEMEITLPFSTDLNLRAAYQSPSKKEIRIGKLLEDLDMLCGTVGMAHANLGKTRAKMVTASVDRIDIIGPICAAQDLRMLARPTWVGTSSLEIESKIESPINTPVLKAHFVMVGLPMESGDSSSERQKVSLPQLALENPKEIARFQAGIRRHEKRLKDKATSLNSKPPTAEESLLLNDLYHRNKHNRFGAELFIPPSLSPARFLSGSNKRAMSSTRVETCLLAHQQMRNHGGSFFGGQIILQGFELAFTAATLFLGAKPRFIHLHDLHFHRPVNIGSFLFINASVNYTDTERNLIHVRAFAYTVDPSNMEDIQFTNTFQFTFQNFSSRPTPEVIPNSYEEMLSYLEGVRVNHLSHPVTYSP